MAAASRPIDIRSGRPLRTPYVVDLGCTTCTIHPTMSSDVVQAVAATFLHTLTLLRALGSCATREYMFLHYDFGMHADGGVDTALPLYVIGVDDDTLAYRIAGVLTNAVDMATEATKRGDTACRLQLQVECGVAPRAKRNRIDVERNVRRAQRLASLWHENRQIVAGTPPSASVLLPSPSTPPTAATAASSSSSSSWWTWMKRSVKTSGATPSTVSSSPALVARVVCEAPVEHRDSVLEQSIVRTDVALQTSGGADSSSASSFVDRNSWEEAVRVAQVRETGRLVGRDAKYGTVVNEPSQTVALSDRETASVRNLAVHELQERAAEDEALCENVWEQWRIDVHLCYDEQQLKPQAGRTIARSCRRLVQDMCARAQDTALLLPPLTTSTWVTCWPLRFHVREVTVASPSARDLLASRGVSAMWDMDDDFSSSGSSTGAGDSRTAERSTTTSACSPPLTTHDTLSLGCELLCDFMSTRHRRASSVSSGL